MRLINRFRIRRALKAIARPTHGSVARLVRRYARSPRRRHERSTAADRVAAYKRLNDRLKVDWPAARREWLAAGFSPYILTDSKPEPMIIGVDLARNDRVDAFAYSIMGYIRPRRSVYDWFLPEEGRPK